MDEQGTRCPNCRIVFRVAASQLHAAGGMVRCGICLATFDALANQTDVKKQALSEAPVWADVDDDDHVIDDRFDLSLLGESVLEKLPDVEKDVLSDTQKIDAEQEAAADTINHAEFSDMQQSATLAPLPPEPEPQFDIDFDKEIKELEDTVFGEDVPGTDRLGMGKRGQVETYVNDSGGNAENAEKPASNGNSQHTAAQVLPEPLVGDNLNLADTPEPSNVADLFEEPLNDSPESESEERPGDIVSSDSLSEFAAANQRAEGIKKASSFRLRDVIVLLLGLGVLAGQWLFFQADQLASQSAYRNLYEPFCQVLPCRGHEFSDLSAIQTKNLVVRTHPRYKGALQVDATLVNLAERSQRFPQMILTFEDLQGVVLARRSFKPAEYLKGDLDGASAMPPRQPVHFILDIMDPGELAVSYTLIPAH